MKDSKIRKPSNWVKGDVAWVETPSFEELGFPFLSPPWLINLVFKSLPHLGLFWGLWWLVGDPQDRFTINEGQQMFYELRRLPAFSSENLFSSFKTFFSLKAFSCQTPLFSVHWPTLLSWGVQCRQIKWNTSDTRFAQIQSGEIQSPLSPPQIGLGSGTSKTIKTSENIRRSKINLWTLWTLL